jgi:urea transporter
MSMGGSAWDDLAGKNRMVGYLDMNLRGAGQVFFQNNPWTGFIILAAIFWGAHAAGNLSVAFGAVAGLLVCTSTAILLHVDRAALRQGLFGLNGVLVGVAVPVFLRHDPMMWAYLILAAAVSTVVTLAIANVVKAWGVSGSTAPFVFTTWMLLLGAYSFTHVPIAAMGPPALPTAASAGNMTLSLHTVLSSLGKNISQVYLIENVWTGVLFVIAIAISSMRSAGFAVIGSAIGLGAAFAFGAGTGAITSGLYGFSAVLTAMAVGSAFEKLSFRVVLYATLATIFTVVVQAALNTALSPIGIPPLTFPYVLTMWIFLLP